MSLVEAERATRAVYEGKGDRAGRVGEAYALGLICRRVAGRRLRWFWLGQSNVVGRIASLAGRDAGAAGKKRTCRNLIDGLQKALG